MNEADIQNLERLKQELDLMEQAKRINAELAKQSFVAWQQHTVSKVGRAFGVVIEIPKQKFNKIWKWLNS